MRPLLHPSLPFILLLVIAATVGAPGAPHHGGKSANPSWLYSWARPRAGIVSQRPPAQSKGTGIISPGQGVKSTPVPLSASVIPGRDHSPRNWDRVRGVTREPALCRRALRERAGG